MKIRSQHEIDQLIATDIMGWALDGAPDCDFYLQGDGSPLPCNEWKPASNLLQAFNVNNVMRNEDLSLTLSQVPGKWASWTAHYTCSAYVDKKQVQADTAAKAICLAALEARNI